MSNSSLSEAVREVRHWLPQQGPIAVFIHHNTLHAFEDQNFESAVERAAEVKGTKPYLSHAEFLAEIHKGRIPETAIRWALQDALGNDADKPLLAGTCSKGETWKALLHLEYIEGTYSSIQWLLEEEKVLGQRYQALWQVVWNKSRNLTVFAPVDKTEPKETSLDQLLIRLCAAYLDEGVADWPMPEREKGFFRAVLNLVEQGDRFLPGFLRWGSRLPVSKEASAVSALEGLLKARGLKEGEWKEFLLEEALALPGWAGTMAALEEKPELKSVSTLKPSLVDYLAVRLLLKGKFDEGEQATRPSSTNPLDVQFSRVFRRTQALQKLGISAERFEQIPDSECQAFFDETEFCSDLVRRRILQKAFEREYTSQILDSLRANQELNKKQAARKKPALFQALFCIDEREESLRRHLEETEPEVETLSVAGFFGVDMLFQGIHEHHGVPLCPVVITPNHCVAERPAQHAPERGESAKQRVSALRRLIQSIYLASRDLWLGLVMSAGAGIAAAVPLFFRLHFPRFSARLIHSLSKRMFPDLETELQLERAEGDPARDGLYAGYTISEMAERVATVLRAIGLTKDFSPLVFVVGHGSNSLNNPHESAHDCGACGGKRGAPNARAFALMANAPKVREKVRSMGLEIPSHVHFVGGYHDTCSDEIVFFDVGKIPGADRPLFEQAVGAFDRARAKDAHERCRRFESAPQRTEKQALYHVEGRCRDLREPRPEYGHATNAFCVVGPRELSRGLFMDRRGFLSSYDYRQDSDGEILRGILGAVIPVCAGISLEYYFSFVDNEGYGCGSKLPHNVTGLIGIMNGALSDLRTGLPWQMVEVHEPVRILFVVEAERWKIEKILAEHAGIRALVNGDWVQLAVLDPQTGATELFEKGKPTPYQAEKTLLRSFAKSRDYYEGHAEHLRPVRIEKETARG